MKKTLVTLVTLLMIITLALTSCSNTDPWKDAVYTEDTALGTGETSFTLIVEVLENSVTFTINTDKTVLGDALQELELIDGEESTYGLYVKVVNGITADYGVDASYWGFYKNGEAMMVGVDGETIEEGASYSLVYTR